MIRGISFKIPKGYNVLNDILRNINIKKYCWYATDDNQVFINDNGLLFKYHNYSGNDFEDILTKGYVYHAYFIKLLASIDTPIKDNLLSYHQYKKSNCQLAILCVDSIFFDIYCKNKDDLETIKTNVIECGSYDIIDIIGDLVGDPFEM